MIDPERARAVALLALSKISVERLISIAVTHDARTAQHWMVKTFNESLNELLGLKPEPVTVQTTLPVPHASDGL